MPAVKTEEFHLRVPNRAFPSSRSPSSLSASPTVRARQFAAERSARLRANASPYRADGRTQPAVHQQRQQTQQNVERDRERQQPLMRNEGSIYALNGSNEPLVRILEHATHEMLSSSGNAAYAEAVKALSHARNEAMEYRRQNVELSTKLTETRSAYDQLVKQYRILYANLEQRIQQQQQQQQQAVHVPQEKVVQAPPTPQESPVTTVNTAELQPQEDYGPIMQPGGFQIKPLVGAYNATSSTRPTNVALETCWTKADWFGRGFSNGSFVRDRNGAYLKHLMRGIRSTARRIWNELDNRGYTLGKSFNKNGANFMDAYIGTIEEIYPCLRLCAGHWKAKQIGIRTYPHWYAGRNKRQASTASGSTAT